QVNNDALNNRGSICRVSNLQRNDHTSSPNWMAQFVRI
ncbi:hypothetical protein pipiens_015448, partial [Culex pipiens pipiens]